MDNIGGLNKIYICPLTALDDNGQITDKSKLQPIPFSTDTAKRQYSRKQDKNGIYYEIDITCKIPHSHNEDIVNSFPAQFAIITTDNNNITRLDGNTDEPIHYEQSSDTGEEFEDLNHIELKFSRKLRQPSSRITL